MAATRTAREVVELYNLVVWNERNFALAEELFADTVIRHEVGEAHTLTHAQAVQRVADVWEMFDRLRFDLNIVIAGDDGEHVAIVYDSTMTTKDGTEINDRQHGGVPRRRRQDHRGLELRLQARSLELSGRTLDELGYYLLAGAGGEGPATLMDEARRGEELGFGTAFISERWNVKEASSLVGAACAVTSRMQIATAATNHNTRHPLITGSWATTMHRLSGGRFTLGIGRGIAAIYGAFGIPAVTTAQMEDWAQVMRRLWHGEVIFNHDGPMGKYPILFLDPDFNEDIRLALVAFGPNTLALGGRVFDDVILHTYFTPETLQRCVKTVKSAAEKAGRDPDSVRVWSCFATVGDHLPEQLRLKKTVARLATYLQGYGDLMVQTNNWDPAVLQRFREDPVVTSIAGGIDHKATPEQIEHIATLIPDEWLEPSATGSAQQCVDRIRKEFDYGADALIMHGATPDELEPVVAAYRGSG